MHIFSLAAWKLKKLKKVFFWITLSGMILTGAGNKNINEFPVPNIPYDPPHYVSYKTGQSLNIDGKLNEKAWQEASWTQNFVNIRGQGHPDSPQPVRAKILWDDENLYFAAEIIEEDIWAKFTERESPLYQENAFEIFIEPDGDTKNYFEFQINALNTTWDLLLFQPYRDGGPGLTSWDITNLNTAVFVDGTLNDPSDTDNKWQIEIAMPWEALVETAPGGDRPSDGDQWRLNFSRVEHPLIVEDGQYTKKINPETDRPMQSNFYTWAPQGIRNMHYPEMYGYLQFSSKIAGTGKTEFHPDPTQDTRWLLRQLYYAQNNYFEKNGDYAGNLSLLNLADIDLNGQEIKLSKTFTDYQIATKDPVTGEIWNIRADGYIWALDEPENFETW